MLSLAAVSRLNLCNRGEVIWLSGAKASFVGLIATGFVKMVRSTADGGQATLEIFGPGQVFGLLGMIRGTGCPLMAHGLTKTAYLKIPKDAFGAVYNTNHFFKDQLVHRTAVRMHQKLDFMAKLSSGRVEERLVAILFSLAESYGVEENGQIRLTVPLTRQVLGELAGTTTETTIRILSIWAQMGLVSTDQQHITICRPAELELKLA